MTWELDPDLALHTKLSLGRRAAGLAALALIGLTLSLLVSGAPGDVVGGLFATVTVLSLVIALPFAAIHLLGLDGDGRLDQQRLSGRSEIRLALGVIGGAAWLLLAFGLPAFLLIPYVRMRPMQLAAVTAMSAAIANLMMAVPRTSQADSRILAALVILTTVGTLSAAGLNPGAVPIILIAGTAVWVATVPLVLRRIRRPAVEKRRRIVNPLRPLVRLGTVRFAELARTILWAGNKAWMLPMAAAAPILIVMIHAGVARGENRDHLSLMVVYVPLIVAGIDASTRLRRERAAGGIERIWLSAQTRWAVVTQLAAGYLIPFAMVSLPAAAMLLWVDPAKVRDMAPWPLVAAFMVFVGIAEGARDRKLGTYVMAAALAGVFAATGQQGRVWWLMFAGVWIPAVMAATLLERAEAAPFRGWQLPLAGASLGAAIAALMYTERNFYFLQSAPYIAGWTALAAGLLLPERPRRDLLHWLPVTALACGGAAALTQYLAIDPRMSAYVQANMPFSVWLWPSTYAMLVGALAAAGLLFGWIAHDRFGHSRQASLVVRMMPLFSAYGLISMMEPGYRQVSARTTLTTFLTYLAALLLAALVLPLLAAARRHVATQS